MIAALIDEIECATTPVDAAVAAGALVVLCDVRIEQENVHLLPALEDAGLDLAGLLGSHPEIIGGTTASPS